MSAKSGTDTERTNYYASFLEDKSDSLLDIGCGTGGLLEATQQISNHGFSVGLDLKKGKKNHMHVVADATKLPFKPATFSLVTAFSLIEHIPEKERKKIFQETQRVMRKNGVFLIQLPNRYALIESHSFLPLFGFLPSRVHSFAYREEAYVSVPSLKTVLDTLEENSFFVYGVERYEAPFLPFGGLLKRLGLLRLFPMGYVIRAYAH